MKKKGSMDESPPRPGDREVRSDSGRLLERAGVPLGAVRQLLPSSSRRCKDCRVKVDLSTAWCDEDGSLCSRCAKKRIAKRLMRG